MKSTIKYALTLVGKSAIEDWPNPSDIVEVGLL
jgi:hypothetical protein